MTTAELDPFTRGRVERIADRALREAGVLGRLPTPLAEVQRAAGIVARHDIGALPAGLATPGRALLGALWFAERAVYVDLAQPAPRRRFTDAHEAMHALCPWHEATLREDTEDELFRATRAALEAEANHGAAELIFQGRAFAERLAAVPPGLAAARALAAEHGASLRATLHQLAARHPAPVALLAVSRFPDPSGPWRLARRRVARLPPPGGPARPHRRRHAAARAGRGRARLRGPAAGARRVDGAPYTAEVHYNRRCFLVLLAPRAALRRAASRRSARRTLPESVRGSASTSSNALGTLKPASRSTQCARSRAGFRPEPGRATTSAVTASPHSGCGREKTADSTTSGCSASTPSTSDGATFSPPVMITSPLRPVTTSRPVGPRSGPGRPCAGSRAS